MCRCVFSNDLAGSHDPHSKRDQTRISKAEERADERVRIARDLHDALLQGIQGLLLTFHVAISSVPEGSETRVRLERALSKADQIVVEGRDRVTRLRTESVTDAELWRTFARWARAKCRSSNLICSLPLRRRPAFATSCRRRNFQYCEKR
jgi:signal transduction histidine kinase